MSAKKSDHKKTGSKTAEKLSPRNQMKISKLKSGTNPPKQQPSTESKKTKGLVSTLKQSNMRRMYKQNATGQNQHEFNLKNLEDSSADMEKYPVEGIVKISDKNVKKAEKNTASDISANVIGKKPDIKFIGNRWLLTVTVVCLVLVALSVIGMVTVAFYFKFQSENPVISFTGEVSVPLQTAGTSAASFSVPRNIIPGQVVAQTVSVTKDETTPAQVVRYKAVYTTGDGEVIPMELHVLANSSLSDDGYYYLNQTILTGEKVELTDECTIPQDYELSLSGKNLNMITFLFETLPVNLSLVNLLWTGAPVAWTTLLFG